METDYPPRRIAIMQAMQPFIDDGTWKHATNKQQTSYWPNDDVESHAIKVHRDNTVEISIRPDRSINDTLAVVIDALRKADGL